MAPAIKRDLFYPLLAVAISVTAFAGFAFTYLGPLPVAQAIASFADVFGWMY